MQACVGLTRPHCSSQCIRPKPSPSLPPAHPHPRPRQLLCTEHPQVPASSQPDLRIQIPRSIAPRLRSLLVADEEERLWRQPRAVEAQHEVQVLWSRPAHENLGQAAVAAVQPQDGVEHAAPAVGVCSVELGPADLGRHAAADGERLPADCPLGLAPEAAKGRERGVWGRGGSVGRG